MATRVRTIGMPKVSAPYKPPVIESIKPLNGTAGSDVYIQGKNFPGWNAYVYVAGKKIMDVLDISSDTFKVTLPGDLVPGFYEVRVDISHLCRRTFFFEVTS